MASRSKTEGISTTDEAVKLEVAVALDARVRRTTGRVIGHVRGDHITLEVLTEVEDMVFDAESVGDSSGVVDIGHSATPRVRWTTPQLHRDSDNLVTGLEQQRCRNRRVDTTRHGDHDRPAHHQPPRGPQPFDGRRDDLQGGVDVRVGRGVTEGERSDPCATIRSIPIAARTWDGILRSAGAGRSRRRSQSGGIEQKEQRLGFDLSEHEVRHTGRDRRASLQDRRYDDGPELLNQTVD